MFSFGDKYRNYLCDNNGLCANLTLFLVFFKKVCAFFCFFAEVKLRKECNLLEMSVG